METTPPTAENPIIPVAGRTCENCAMCCKIPVIPELNKPYNIWCQHCVDYSSCGIHPTRPQRCREFFCHFMLSTLSEEWRPSKSRLLITTYDDRILVMVDPSRPDAWRKEPFLSNLRRWSEQISVYAMLGPVTYAIFPDHIDDLGEVTEDHQIMILEEQTAQGPRRRAQRVLKSEAATQMQGIQQ